MTATETAAIACLKAYNDEHNQNMYKVNGRWRQIFDALVADGHAVQHSSGPILNGHPFLDICLDIMRRGLKGCEESQVKAKSVLDAACANVVKARAELERLEAAVGADPTNPTTPVDLP